MWGLVVLFNRIKKNNDKGQKNITDNRSQEHSLVEKYIQYCQKEGVPDEIIELMKQQGMTLMHCMQIKYGYEDGLDVKDIRQYAYPTCDKQQCVNIRFQLLKDKDVSFTMGTSRCPNCKKRHAMKEIGRTLVDIRDSTERVDKSYYDPQTRMKEYYTDIVDATVLKYDVVQECQYCGYRKHSIYSEKKTNK